MTADKASNADLCLVQCLQSLLVVPFNILQLLQSLFLLLQGLHVNLLTLHLRKELIHCLSERITLDSHHTLAQSVNSYCNGERINILFQTNQQEINPNVQPR